VTERIYKTSKEVRARSKAYYAIRAGDLIPQPCEVCGATKHIHAHHDDYDKPLEVRWLCSPHHHEAHGRTARPPKSRSKRYEGYNPPKTVIYTTKQPVGIIYPKRTYWPKWWRNQLNLKDGEKST
jgi:hypothetical protein